ncbi:hypothetical protein [Alteromonas gilva]|uniref:STAS/SEC14 domain-containing protein n=1 Tax=Alteromonas gilva TaxID=2987522 RepID=A0ABT5L675_9ALTE|nr:hypothetical protein [Alteromonas gilva]MDC8832555.1 hypothetical protein [Alteromonas gilva]
MTTNGGYRLWTTGNILHARVHGIWNGRIATAYNREFMVAALPLSNKPWAHMVYLDQWVLGTPEIEPVIKELAGWCAEHQLVCAAHVYSDNMLKEYQLNKMLKNAPGAFELQHFTSFQTAQQWLSTHNFYVSENDLTTISD